MRIETRKLLADVTAACASIESFVAGRSFDDYVANELLRAAVERKFGIVGEALTRLQATDPSAFDAIEDAALIVGLRNRLIHGVRRRRRPHPLGQHPERPAEAEGHRRAHGGNG